MKSRKQRELEKRMRAAGQQVAERIVTVVENSVKETPATCKGCGHLIASKYSFCPYCGGDPDYQKDAEVVICQKCGAFAPYEIWNQRV